MNQQERAGFATKFGVVAAAAGSAVGLGNIWRFPYVAGENGGGAFLLIYLFFVLGIGVPVMLSEFIIGRKSRRNPYGAFKALAPRTPWPVIGIMGIVAAFVILAFYSTIAGWTIEYIIKSVQNGFEGGSTEEIFATFKSGTFKPLVWQFVFMLLTAFIVVLGVQKGIERYTKILMPVLVLLILAMCIRSVTLEGASKGLSFLFKPDFSKININIILEALGQAAFSLSIGMGALITYGSYINKHNNLSVTALQVGLADTLIAILAGVMIFPAVFALGLDPQAGPGLVFEVLPKLFMKMPLGYYFSIMFFILLAVAALTSTVSILEVVVVSFSEEFKISRIKSVILSTVAIWVVGIFATLSFSDLSDFTIFGRTIFDNLDYISANILLPLGALLIVVFLGWYLKIEIVREEFETGANFKTRFFTAFYFILRFIAPVAIIFVFLHSLGLFK